MNESGGYYPNLNKSDRGNQIPYNLSCMWNLKSKQKIQVLGCEGQMGGYQRGRGWGGMEWAKGSPLC